MLTQELQGGNIAYGDALFGSKLNAGANAAAIITLAAPSNGRWVINKLYWSYNGDPTGGNILVTGGINNFDLDVTKGGPGSFALGPYVGAYETQVEITLHAGGGGVTGKVMIDYILRQNQ